ncbi:hypothetical protein PR202_ga19419 [Eleusine coracana subsp. coracana]|uniref:Splicing factor Cactin n=1 Tax=Eleusine coracana subsp. coracana TaxID=191504 RepID=A0AAV5CU11_ELECO|nr:hypothetical protein PR202_ga19419 [Eleusine coracana subsp. coracana]
MAKQPRSSSVSPARGTTRPLRRLAKAVHRRAVAVSEKLASRGLGAFVWRKKLDRDLARGALPSVVSARSERRRCLARRAEAERVMLTSAAASSRRASPPPLFPTEAETTKEEAAFLLGQSRRRAAIRFAAGRPVRVDFLVASLDGTSSCALAAFRGASMEELKALREEIVTQAELGKANAHFWEAATAICDAETVKSVTAGRGEGVLHSEVVADVESVVEGKSLDELDAMERTIAARVAAGEAEMVEHWQEVAQLIRVEKARKFLAQNYSTRDDDAPLSLDAETAGTERLLERRVDEDGSSEPLSPYNRAHYDRDHPPPRTVRGYRFVLHYPDLAAGGKALPRYTVEEDGGSGGETCIVRFRAGWPYEDVAFRVVNRDWERSRKAGFIQEHL